jgi:flagella basal body P-ring formation protein FlgA
VRSLVVILLLGTGLPAAAEGLIQIGTDESVERATITLGQIARFRDFPEARREALAALSLGPSAPPSRARVLTDEAIRSRIERVDPKAIVEVPSQVRVHTAYREIDPKEFREKLERAIRLRMPWESKAVRFSRWSLPAKLAVPAHAHQMTIRFRPEEDFLGRVNATISVSDPEEDAEAKVERAASVEVDARSPVVIAAKALRRGQTLDRKSIRMEERELRELPRGILTSPEQVVGKRVARSVSAGGLLLRPALQLERIVQRNQTIKVEARTDGLDLTMEARALENGVLGQMIRVENPSSRRRFFVEVIGDRRGRVGMSEVGAAP